MHDRQFLESDITAIDFISGNTKIKEAQNLVAVSVQEAISALQTFEGTQIRGAYITIYSDHVGINFVSTKTTIDPRAIVLYDRDSYIEISFKSIKKAAIIYNGDKIGMIKLIGNSAEYNIETEYY